MLNLGTKEKSKQLGKSKASSFAGILPFCQLSDEEFELALYEQINGHISYDSDRLASLKFNPLLSEYYNNKLQLSRDHV